MKFFGAFIVTLMAFSSFQLIGQEGMGFIKKTLEDRNMSRPAIE